MSSDKIIKCWNDLDEQEKGFSPLIIFAIVGATIRGLIGGALTGKK
ncbi:hypothetical protein M1589_04815 [Candidatus Marsarchaeota archaeon]|nr:hypothetical protein [Candidatus Marsarchaeota archaeon]MCL5115433.1 hypothetical protein [Candidatus Marsarchaeota archaeon]